MRALTLLAAAGLFGNVISHPHARANPRAQIVRRGPVNLDAFRLPLRAEYVNSTKVEHEANFASFKLASYVDTAKGAVNNLVPGATYRLVEDHYVGSGNIAHVNFKQTANGIDIDNADFNVNVGPDGTVFSYGNNFYTGEIPGENPTESSLQSPVDALRSVSSVLGLPVSAVDATAEASDGGYVIKSVTGIISDPKVKLVYLVNQEGGLSLSWRVETDTGDNWLLSYADALDGGVVHAAVDWVSDLTTFEVYPWGINDPTEGSRQVIPDPWNIEASEFTWLGNGDTTYNTTRGNNAIAQSNPSGGSAYLNNYRPDTPALAFEYPFTTADSDPSDYVNASITQLFYTANMYHDLLYVLGFNEQAGNFETNNNGQGGLGNDFVILNAQDGSGTNNANFATPPDGSPGRMRMYLWTRSTPRRDCSFEAGVVIHEYTHGVSNRLTGGPSNSNCLNSLESGGMGEGWGDFMATAIRLKPNDTRTTDYPMGAWVDNSPEGIRQYVYSTSLTTNPQTYITVNARNQVHAIGEIWANMLYEVLWNLIDKHGKNDAGFPTFEDGVPTDGKFLTMKLVIDGMALQPCNPNFVQARDAIIDADRALTNGANKCEIWTAFAKRGLGQGAVYSPGRRTESFDLPADC